MNWAVFALSVSGALAAVWLWLVMRRNWSAAGLYASLGCLIAACFNAAAPVRSALDPNYVGYQFGLAGSERGLGVTMVAGAIFLFAYALLALRRALKPEVLTAAKTGEGSLKVVIAACLAFTFLNPHVYLDTVLLIGSLSAAYQGAARIAYGAGAGLASFVWFFGLGYGARLLQPVFARPAAWRVLDVMIAVVMTAIANGLLV